MRRPRSGTREGARGTYRRGACGSCTETPGASASSGRRETMVLGRDEGGVRLAAGRAKRRGAERRGAHRAVHGRGTHRDVRSPAERFQLGGHRADVFGHVRVPQRTAALRASGRFRGCDGRAGQRGRASARRGGETEARGREKTHAHLARREKHAAARSRCRSRPVDRRAAESAVELMRPISNGSRAAQSGSPRARVAGPTFPDGVKRRHVPPRRRRASRFFDPRLLFHHDRTANRFPLRRAALRPHCVIHML